MKKVLFMVAMALLFVACEKGQDYSVIHKAYSCDVDTTGFVDFVFLEDYVQVTYNTDSFVQGVRHVVLSFPKYEQHGQHVIIQKALYEVFPLEKDSDLHIKAYGSHLEHAGRTFICVGSVTNWFD